MYLNSAHCVSVLVLLGRDVRSHILLENLAFCSLRISEIHHLVEEFVDDDKVISYTLLF